MSPSLQEVELSQQWVVVLQDIPKTGLHWKIEISSKVMQNSEIGDTAPLEAMRSDLNWKGDLIRCGDIYSLKGHWYFQAERRCSRCTDSFDMDLEGDTNCDFCLGTDASNSDASCFLPPPGKLNLVDVLREDIWLAWPQDVVCRVNCQGLCPVCGCNRNKDKCRCHETDLDNPFAVLGKINLS